MSAPKSTTSPFHDLLDRAITTAPVPSGRSDRKKSAGYGGKRTRSHKSRGASAKRSGASRK